MQQRNEMPDAYKGREQAYVKHELLRGYLEKLFMIVGTSRAMPSELCYVDCFAGPWGDESEDMNTTSIAVSLDTLAACLRKIREVRNVTIRALYVERDPHSFKRLDAYLKSHKREGVTAEAIEGDFVELRAKILNWVGIRPFAFFFIDPKGWSPIGVPVLRPLLSRGNAEFLVNFMYFSVNRTLSMPEWQSRMHEVLGQSLGLEGLDPEGREELIVNTYRTSCKAVMKPSGRYPPRSAYVRVMNPKEDRPKYHLIYFTAHHSGIIAFMEQSEHVNLIQRRVHTQIRMDERAASTGMGDLFTADEYVPASDGGMKEAEVDAVWLSHLHQTGGCRRVDSAAFASLLEQTNVLPSDLQNSLLRLIKARRVRNVDAKRPRTKKPLHHEDNEQLCLEEAIEHHHAH